MNYVLKKLKIKSFTRDIQIILILELIKIKSDNNALINLLFNLGQVQI